eukprot:366097-Chlamydomonas_euryale.AAC.20
MRAGPGARVGCGGGGAGGAAAATGASSRFTCLSDLGAWPALQSSNSLVVLDALYLQLLDSPSDPAAYPVEWRESEVGSFGLHGQHNPVLITRPIQTPAIASTRNAAPPRLRDGASRVALSSGRALCPACAIRQQRARELGACGQLGSAACSPSTRRTRWSAAPAARAAPPGCGGAPESARMRSIRHEAGAWSVRDRQTLRMTPVANRACANTNAVGLGDRSA